MTIEFLVRDDSDNDHTTSVGTWTDATVPPNEGHQVYLPDSFQKWFVVQHVSWTAADSVAVIVE
jgi:hypothetical protein